METPAQTSETPKDDLITRLMAAHDDVVRYRSSMDWEPDDNLYREAAEALTASQSSLAAERREREKAEQEREAIRTLMNVYNLGGWTDAIAPMKRALEAEARIAELEKDAARYRRIRSDSVGRKWKHTPIPLSWIPEDDDEDSPVITDDAFDSVIDAALPAKD